MNRQQTKNSKPSGSRFHQSTCYDSTDGYRAYKTELKSMMNVAKEKTPKRLKDGYKKRAEYREGYYDALLTLWCMTALIDHPNNSLNQKRIQKTLNNHNERDKQ
jgi:hypothetical protein